MQFFDFHHHHPSTTNGIYNLNFGDSPIESLYSIGIHPQDIKKNNTIEQLSWIEKHITKNCFAIGECGLDSTVAISKDLQEELFYKQIIIAEEFSKPVTIHCVRKYYEVISFRKKTKQAMIIHGFNKKQSIAEDLIKNNFHLSFGKAVLYNLSLQNTLKIIPLERLFLETDNEDFDIEELYTKVAEIKNITIEQLHQQILDNLETIRNG